MKKFYAILEITRPLNLLITFAVVYVSAIICSGIFHPTFNVLLACFSAVLVAAAGNIINDYYDFKIDKINRPSRPIPSGRLSKKEALILFIILIIIALLISYLISFEAVIIVSSTIVLLFYYSYYFKGVPLIGNIIIACCTAFVFIYGGIVVGNFKASLIPALFAFLINLIREILKDVEDLEGDEKNQISTFPIKFGLPLTKKAISVLVFILLFATFYPFIFRLYKIEYFLIVMFLVNLPIIYLLREIYSKDFLSKLSKLSLSLKLIMIFGLIAIYMGQF